MKITQNSNHVALFVACFAGTNLLCDVHAIPLRNRPYLVPEPVDWNATRSPSEIDGKSWRIVLAWFAEQTQISFQADVPIPEGQIRFIAPKGRQFKLTEIFDILNERLQASEKLMLVRSKTALTLIPADQDIPPHHVPRLRVDDLPQRGRTELVEVVMRLRPGQNPEELMPASKDSRGPFIHATSVGDHQFIIRAHVGTLQHMRKVSEALQRGSP